MWLITKKCRQNPVLGPDEIFLIINMCELGVFKGHSHIKNAFSGALSPMAQTLIFIC